MTSINEIVLLEIKGSIAHVTLNRPDKYNALSNAVFSRLNDVFGNLPEEVGAVVLSGNGKHFCSGLDLGDLQHCGPFESVFMSQRSHALFKRIQDCGRPVISAMHGAVIGGGLEMACATHIRIADPSTYFQLPEGRRGIFVGGGGSVRIGRIIGTGRLTEMMLTGRRVDADLGERIGLVHYLVPPGEVLNKAMEIAETVVANAKISNFLMLNALRHIGEMPEEAGYFTESVAQSLALTSADSGTGIEAFLDKKEAKF